MKNTIGGSKTKYSKTKSIVLVLFPTIFHPCDTMSGCYFAHAQEYQNKGIFNSRIYQQRINFISFYFILL